MGAAWARPGSEGELRGEQEAEDLLATIRSGQGSSSNPGSWNADALRLGEAVANDLVQEVAEWSVLYAKEIAEP